MADDPKVVEIKTKKPLSPKRLEALAKARAARKKDKPATGNEGSSPATGPGWGGEAHGTREAFSSDYQPNPEAVRALSAPDVEAKLMANLYELAFKSEFEQSRINATSKLLDRIAGTPIQRTITDHQKIPLPGVVIGVRPKIVGDGRN